MNGTPIPSRRSILALGDDQISAVCAAASQAHDTLPSLRGALAGRLGRGAVRAVREPLVYAVRTRAQGRGIGTGAQSALGRAALDYNLAQLGRDHLTQAEYQALTAPWKAGFTR